MSKKVKIFADGAARGNPDGPGGYGAILQYTDTAGQLHEKELSEGFKKTTNNRMELLGVIAALECLRHDGLHIRHLDLLVEIVDPVTGEALPAGSIGEIVFTTLRQKAMPLLRYRTGDASWLVPGPCACQSPSARLGGMLGRFEAGSRRINHPLKAERCHVLAGADPFEACTGAGS